MKKHTKHSAHPQFQKSSLEMNSEKIDVTTGTTTSQSVDEQLLFMIEEEKMAKDLYDALYEATGLNIFDQISDSEQNHMDALIAQADRLDISTNDLILDVAGEFSNTDIQSLYDQLLAKGAESVEGAVTVGLDVETADINDLLSAIESSGDITLIGVYTNLLDASYSHLDSFTAF